MKNSTPIISPDELSELRGAAELRLFDVCNNPSARKNYDANHLEGAIFVDINTQLADIKPSAADGGRHPLPSPQAFSRVLSSLGITPQCLVVVYDDKNGANAAARFWWMLRAAGLENVQVLDGGIQAAIAGGFPTSDEQKAFEPTNYAFDEWKLPTADLATIDAVFRDQNFLIIDVREKPRFDGETEPFDKVAGHIPNAVNIPFSENLDENGRFLPREKLREKYEAALSGFDAEKVIVHCGSGVTACHTLLALDYAGIAIPNLYVGSWSEWSENGREFATAKTDE